MPGVLPFQTLSNADRPQPGELAIALGAEFGVLDSASAHRSCSPPRPTGTCSTRATS
jgi:hypothetical protein